MRWLGFIFSMCGLPASADIVVADRVIRPGMIIAAGDLQQVPGEDEQSFDRVDDVIGQEARVALYPGRPIHFDAVGPPALVERNQIVALRFVGAGLLITTEGRALQRGAAGDRVRIMNLASRATLFGFVRSDGSIDVVQ